MPTVPSKGVREPEISGQVGNTKFFQDRDGYPKISRFSNLSGFSKELGFGTSLNNSLKPMSSTVSKGRRSRTIVRTIPSVISFGLTIFRVSFCTCDKFYIDSVSFLVHVLMFECICFKWRNKLVVLAYLVLNSWWRCVHSAFVSSFSWKCSQTELLFTFFLCTISSATTTLLSLSLDFFFEDFQSLLNSHTV